jgi:transcriptional regulator with XRE-family HTH domain
MQQPTKPTRGRPIGTKTFDPLPAIAFGKALKEIRIQMGLSQERLANVALIERSHVGKIERGQHLPNFSLIIKLANALSVKPGVIVDRAAELMD